MQEQWASSTSKINRKHTFGKVGTSDVRWQTHRVDAEVPTSSAEYIYSIGLIAIVQIKVYGFYMWVKIFIFYMRDCHHACKTTYLLSAGWPQHMLCAGVA